MKLKLKLSDGSIKEVEGTVTECMEYEAKLKEQGVSYEVVKESVKKTKLLLDSKTILLPRNKM